jgi:hypothetical protein
MACINQMLYHALVLCKFHILKSREEMYNEFFRQHVYCHQQYGLMLLIQKNMLFIQTTKCYMTNKNKVNIYSTRTNKLIMY